MNQREYARLETRDGQAVNLKGVKLSGDLRGLMFEACVEQRFCNPGDKNIEVVYSFPLPWGAVLLGVDVLLGDKHLTGTVVEKKEAEAHYEEALSEGNAAIMLEKNYDHSYSLNLGNLAAGEHCAITLRYAQTLQFEQHGLRLLIPTVIAPRYGDAVQDGGLAPHQTLEHSLIADYPFALEIRLHGDLAQSRVASPSHPISVAHENNGLTVSLARQASLDQDFVLVVDQLAQDSIAIAARDSAQYNDEPESVAILASFCPRIQAESATTTAVKILVDCSGSMAGDSIDAAKRALQAIVQQFGAGDRFSLSRFGSSVEHRSRGLWKATETTRLTAQRWVGGLEADLGGTEMEDALSSTFALAQTVSSDVLLVTDGGISAIDRTIESAKASGHRLFVVGIGSSPAETHLRRLAEATGGACDFVAPGEAVEPAVLRMFARLRSPRLAGLSLDWPAGVTPEWVSPLSPSVFDGDTVNVFALLRQAPAGELRLLGKRSEDEAPQEISHVTFADELEAADTLSRMTASVRFHAIGNDATGKPLRLALAYQLLTDKTNFLLIHERQDGEKAIDMPVLQKVEQMVPAGWGGVGSAIFLDVQKKDVRCSMRMCMRSPAMMPQLIQKSSNEWDGIPAFIRKQRDIDRNNPRYWMKSAHYQELTPLGINEWLRTMSVDEWPTTYTELRQIGIGAWLLDWLEFSMASHGGIQHAESKVVATFLYLMSRQAIHNALAKPAGIFKFTLQRLKGMLSREPAADPANIDLSLLEAMAAALNGMTDGAWPDGVHPPQDYPLENSGVDPLGIPASLCQYTD